MTRFQKQSSVVSKFDPCQNQILQYQTSIGSGDFYWGSNGVVANYGMLTLVAYLLSKDPSYLESSIHSLDYLLGRNATGYSFVTGFGSRSARNPHHRPSTADGIPELFRVFW
jgi:endoglucanase